MRAIVAGVGASWVVVVACADPGDAPTQGTDESSTGSTSSSTIDVSSDTSSTSSEGGAVSTVGDDTEGTTGEAGCPPTRGAWRSYGYDASNTRHVAEETAITPTSARSLAPVWSVEPLAGVTSTPAVSDGVVYFADWDGDVHARCFGDGAEVWSVSIAQQITASPLVTDALVVVPDARGNMHAVDRRTGAEVWSIELDAHPNANIFSSPVLADDDTIVIGVASVELGLDLEDYSFRGSVVALDASDGTELWRFYTTENDATAGAGVSVWSTAAVDAARGLVFIGTGNTYEDPASPYSDSLLALDIVTGDIVWSRQFTPDDVYVIPGDAPQGPDADVGASPNLFEIGGQAVVGVGDKAGRYMVLDRETGDLVWMRQLAEGSPLGGVMVTAAVGDGAIFVVSNTWTELFAFGNPANTATVYALDASDGVPLWERPVPQPVFGALTLAGGVLVFVDVAGRIVALHGASGSELWSAEPGGDFGGGFSVVDGRLLVGHGFWFLTQPPKKAGGFVVYAPTER